MEFLHVLSTSDTTSGKEKFLGVFEDREQARIAGSWWSSYNGHTNDVSWVSIEDLDTAQIDDYTWLHIRTAKANVLVE